MTVVQITLPDALAKEAANAGLLTPTALEKLLREELRVSRVEKLKSIRKSVAVEQLAAMTPEEIAAEIEAFRTEKPCAAGS